MTTSPYTYLNYLIAATTAILVFPHSFLGILTSCLAKFCRLQKKLINWMYRLTAIREKLGAPSEKIRQERQWLIDQERRVPWEWFDR